MINLIKKCLEQRKEIHAYKINEEITNSTQLFYVYDKLEMNRYVNKHDIAVTIYVKQDDLLGENEFNVYPYDDESSILANIDQAINLAKSSLNPYYELPKIDDRKIESKENNLFIRPMNEIINEVVNTTLNVKKDENSSLTATEFFFNDSIIKVINSNGVNLQEHRQNIGIELIPTYEKDGKEVEIYEYLTISNLDLNDLENKIREALKSVEDRYNAIDLPFKGTIDIIVQNDEVSQIMDYFVSDLNYFDKYQNTNRYEINDDIQSSSKNIDRLTIDMVANYPGAAYSRHFDNDGLTLNDINIINNGKAVNRYGSNKYGQYIKEQQPTGNLLIKKVAHGCFDINIRKKPYIRCVKFSGIQVENDSGFVGGEVRLGYYFDGEKEIPVTGFSISGNMREQKEKMLLSKEETTLKDYHGPKYLVLKDMEVV